MNTALTLIEASQADADVTIYDGATHNHYTWDGDDAKVGEIAEAYAAKYDVDFSTGGVRIRMEFADETVWGGFGEDRKFTSDNKAHF